MQDDPTVLPMQLVEDRPDGVAVEQHLLICHWRDLFAPQQAADVAMHKAHHKPVAHEAEVHCGQIRSQHRHQPSHFNKQGTHVVRLVPDIFH